jgi:hypothetical protein
MHAMAKQALVVVTHVAIIAATALMQIVATITVY